MTTYDGCYIPPLMPETTLPGLYLVYSAAYLRPFASGHLQRTFVDTYVIIHHYGATEITGIYGPSTSLFLHDSDRVVMEEDVSSHCAGVDGANSAVLVDVSIRRYQYA
jgi:hypothetical protein